MLDLLVKDVPATGISSQPKRVAVINSICVGNDAISEAVRGTIRSLCEIQDTEVRLFAYKCDFPEIDFKEIRSTSDLLLDSFFCEADVLYYHFGVYYDFMNTILIGNGHARRVVRYHNVTPKAFVPASRYAITEKSLRQRAVLSSADVILADSAYNRDDLIQYGISSDSIVVSPLYVKFETDAKIREPEAEKRQVNILYVGRFVESKGVTDLIEALSGLRDQSIAFHLRLAGNLSFSDPTYVARIKSLISSLGFDNCVSFEGEVSDSALLSFYAQADIFMMPSYHEGFCVPILEAYHFGCVPIAYNAGNLPAIIGNVGLLVETGDVAALDAAILYLAKQMVNGFPAAIELDKEHLLSASDYHRAVADHLEEYSFTRFAESAKSACILQTL